MIGEACMIRAFNRKQQDSESKQSISKSWDINEIEKEGVEDILEKVDLSIVYEYQHVFEHVGKLHEFKRLYVERREVSEYEDKSKCISHNVILKLWLLVTWNLLQQSNSVHYWMVCFIVQLVISMLKIVYKEVLCYILILPM
mgnify:CR=1 FL=1